MTVIHDFVQKLINRQISDSGLVIWYDPGGFYQDLVNNLVFMGTNLLVYKDSFFALRAQIEPFLDQPEPSKLLVYVPMDPTQTQHALIELESAGVMLKPGAVPPTCNTRPAYIARQALQPILGEEATQAIEKQVEEGKLTLANLEELAEQGSGLSKGVVSLIFGTGSPQEVALAFLSSNDCDAELVAKEAMPELAALLQTVYEIRLPSNQTPAETRKMLARFILVSDMLYHLTAPLPAALTSVAAATKPAARESCAGLAHSWRNRRDLCESYMAQANQIEAKLHLVDLPLSLEQLQDAETFLGNEQRLIELVTTGWLEGISESLVILAEKRQSSFWAEQYSELQAQWALIVASGRVLLQADKIEKALKTVPTPDPGDLAKLYTSEDEPWCLLDTNHRNMERRIHLFDFNSTGGHKALEQLITKAREHYMKMGDLLAEQFVKSFADKKFSLPGLLRQRDIFDKHVKPGLMDGKLAYVWVDALRYEMGRELAANLVGEFDVTILPAVASVPTITEIGMASLLPIGKESIKLFSPAEGKLALDVDGTPIKDRKDRVAYLNSHTYLKIVDTRLDDLLPNPKKAIREGINIADLVLVTSQEIDELCEGDNIHLARRIMDDMLYELRRVFRILRNLGVQTIICTADHGYLFGEEVGVDMKIDSPGGNTIDLHRRVWVGHGGAANQAVLHVSLSNFGWETDLELATPWNFACFKVKGGSRAYFHGGLSPQELFIPVLTIRPVKKVLTQKGSFVWKLAPGTPKISTRFYSVQVSGEAAELFEFRPPRVRIEVRSDSEALSTPISASYGFSEATGDVQLRSLAEDPRKVEPNTITLMITKEPTQKKALVSVVLFDAETGLELSRLDEIELAFSI